MINYHKEVLRAVSGFYNDYNWQNLVLKITIENPEAVCRALGLEPLEIRTLREFDSGGKVAAIRYLREHTSPTMGLIEAKEQVEDWIEGDL